MIPDIYVEISARRAGKTTRLLAAVRDWLRADNINQAVVYYTGHKFQYTDALQGMLRTQDFDERVQVVQHRDEEEGSLGVEKVRRFFDDWDQPGGQPFFDPTGYYATTLSRLRNFEQTTAPPMDLFERLWQATSDEKGPYLQRFEARFRIQGVSRKEQWRSKLRTPQEHGDIFRWCGNTHNGRAFLTFEPVALSNLSTAAVTRCSVPVADKKDRSGLGAQELIDLLGFARFVRLRNLAAPHMGFIST